MKPSYEKYLPFQPVNLPDRTWPDHIVNKAPVWCSVDLRDGNQALAEPMDLDDKLELFGALVGMGFREIEVGFPSASQTEYDCVRALIERELIPDDVFIQVLMPARPELIEKTFHAVRGAKNVIMHLYNATSPFFRRVVFKKDMDEVVMMAVEGAKYMYELSQRQDPSMNIRFEYSPEHFSATENDYAVRICAEVMEALHATKEKPVILNLPTTVQLSTPNHYADQIERFCRMLPNREAAIISTHPHNDRGTGVADAELALMAGAERVEGTLFGNGERTGNVDLVTLGLNLHTQGVDPELDFRQLPRVRRIYETSTGMRVHPRSPYAGDLVFTAFSGTHQDAIQKAFDDLHKSGAAYWNMPYLPIDPADVGREYEPIIRINSQSGKGGAAFVLHDHFGFQVPRIMHAEFGALVKAEADLLGEELSAEQLMRLFAREYRDVTEPYMLTSHSIEERGAGGHSIVRFTGTIRYGGSEHIISGEGNGPIDAFFSAMHKEHIDGFRFASYHEHAISSGSDAKAVAYIELIYRGRSVFGVGIESNVSIASIKGVLSAVNRALKAENMTIG